MTDIEKQWAEFLKNSPPENVPDITDEELKEALIHDLSKVCEMTVEEYTLYQKWLEIREKFPVKHNNTLFGSNYVFDNPEQEDLINYSKNNIWSPKSIDDYMNIQPIMIYTDEDYYVKGKSKSSKRPELWNTMRTFLSTMKNNSNIGRNLNFLVQDEVTGKFLGVICISSDFLDLTPRDKWIEWDRTLKTSGSETLSPRINYTAIGSTIVPTQPLGYNYVGGKLLALLCLSDTVQNLWKEKYGDVLAGVTTTSLYGKSKTGGLSQYDRLSHWKKMGYTSGTVAYETTKKTQYMIRQWLHKHYTYQYFEWYAAKKPDGKPYKRDHRNRSYHFTYKKLGIPKEYISSEHARGIYFSPLYDNTKEFLRGEIGESQLVKSFDTSEKTLANLWKTKYASKRIKNLLENDRVSDASLFYDDLIYMETFEEVKEKYLSQVGR